MNLKNRLNLLTISIPLLTGCTKVEPCPKPIKTVIAKQLETPKQKAKPKEKPNQINKVIDKLYTSKPLGEPAELCINKGLYYYWPKKGVTPVVDDNGGVYFCDSDFFEYRKICIKGFMHYQVKGFVTVALRENAPILCEK